MKASGIANGSHRALVISAAAFTGVALGVGSTTKEGLLVAVVTLGVIGFLLIPTQVRLGATFSFLVAQNLVLPLILKYGHLSPVIVRDAIIAGDSLVVLAVLLVKLSDGAQVMKAR